MRPRPRAPQQRRWFPVRALHQTRTTNAFAVAPWLPALRQRQRQLGAVHKGWRSVAIRERRWAGAPKTRLRKTLWIRFVRERSESQARFSCTEPPRGSHPTRSLAASLPGVAVASTVQSPIARQDMMRHSAKTLWRFLTPQSEIRRLLDRSRGPD